LLCFFSVWFQISLVMVAPIGVKFCMLVHIGPRQIFSFGSGFNPGIPTSEILGLNFGHLTTNVSKTLSRSITCQLELDISSTKAFEKCKSQAGCPCSECTLCMASLCLADALVCKSFCMLLFLCRLLFNPLISFVLTSA